MYKNKDNDEDEINENKALLTHYSEMREEVRMTIELHNKRIYRGIGAIGVVIGYSLLSDQFMFLSLVPIMIGFLYLRGISSLTSIYFLSPHILDIKDKISLDEFSYVFLAGVLKGFDGFL